MSPRKQTIPALLVFLTLSAFMTPAPARADMFGGDIVVLSQILINAIQQLVQLKQIVNSGTDNLSLIREINQGINDSLNLIRTVNPNSDPGLYRDWQQVSEALNQINGIYGVSVPSSDAKIQKDADQSVAEAITLNNSVYQYSKEIDDIGEQIKQYSHDVSPGGAQKLTAESMGVMLHVLNTSLRANATALKIQAQSLAIQNHQDKELTRHMSETGQTLQAALKSENPTFQLPRF